MQNIYNNNKEHRQIKQVLNYKNEQQKEQYKKSDIRYYIKNKNKKQNQKINQKQEYQPQIILNNLRQQVKQQKIVQNSYNKNKYKQKEQKQKQNSQILYSSRKKYHQLPHNSVINNTQKKRASNQIFFQQNHNNFHIRMEQNEKQQSKIQIQISYEGSIITCNNSDHCIQNNQLSNVLNMLDSINKIKSPFKDKAHTEFNYDLNYSHNKNQKIIKNFNNDNICKTLNNDFQHEYNLEWIQQFVGKIQQSHPNYKIKINGKQLNQFYSKMPKKQQNQYDNKIKNRQNQKITIQLIPDPKSNENNDINLNNSSIKLNGKQNNTQNRQRKYSSPQIIHSPIRPGQVEAQTKKALFHSSMLNLPTVISVNEQINIEQQKRKIKQKQLFFKQQKKRKQLQQKQKKIRIQFKKNHISNLTQKIQDLTQKINQLKKTKKIFNQKQIKNKQKNFLIEKKTIQLNFPLKNKQILEQNKDILLQKQILKLKQKVIQLQAKIQFNSNNFSKQTRQTKIQHITNTNKISQNKNEQKMNQIQIKNNKIVENDDSQHQQPQFVRSNLINKPNQFPDKEILKLRKSKQLLFQKQQTLEENNFLLNYKRQQNKSKKNLRNLQNGKIIIRSTAQILNKKLLTQNKFSHNQQNNSLKQDLIKQINQHQIHQNKFLQEFNLFNGSINNYFDNHNQTSEIYPRQNEINLITESSRTPKQKLKNNSKFNQNKVNNNILQNFSRQMLEFNTERQKYLIQNIDSQQNKTYQNDPLKFHNQNIANINDFKTFQGFLPTLPNLPFPPTPQNTQQELIELGNCIFLLFSIQKIKDSLTLLNIKRYKNCIYFSIDSTNNILWHYDGKIYFGGWKHKQNSQGQKFGQGIQFSPNKYIYSGQFNYGKRNGLGIMKYFHSNNSTNIYIGQFLNNKKHGRGKIIQDNGIIYQGQWKQNKKHGNGILQLENGHVYKGTFQYNQKSGFGQEKFKNDDSYKGQYKNNKFNGKGHYIWRNGANYQGQFHDGQRQGRGIWKSSNNQQAQIYDGQYQNDKKNGYGIYKWPNGSYYEGNFKNDKKNGIGKTKYQNGKVVVFQWKQGKPQKTIPQNQWEKYFNSTNPNKNSFKPKLNTKLSKSKAYNSNESEQSKIELRKSISLSHYNKSSSSNFLNAVKFRQNNNLNIPSKRQERIKGQNSSSIFRSRTFSSKSINRNQIRNQKISLGQQLRQAEYKKINPSINFMEF